jgi:Ca-activated chloride channel family protein
VQSVRGFEIPVAAQREEKEARFAEIRNYADNLRANGGTALYDAIYAALEQLQAERKKSPGYAYSVLVFTDGERTQGVEIDAFLNRYAALDAGAKKIPVFLVLYAEGDERALKKIAEATGGKVFDARKVPLQTVFKEIRSYQ